jgi:hypothetical protein
MHFPLANHPSVLRRQGHGGDESLPENYSLPTRASRIVIFRPNLMFQNGISSLRILLDKFVLFR